MNLCVRRILASALSCAALAVFASVTAHADELDDQFLAGLAKQGITGQPDQLITLAHQSCDTVGSMSGIGPYFRLMSSIGLSPPQAASFQSLAVNTYCPDKSSWLGPPATVPQS